MLFYQKIFQMLNNFLDLANAIALFRPGPASSIPSFIKRKEGLEEIDYFHQALKNLVL